MHWTTCFEYIERALNLSKLLGKQNIKIKECLDTIYTTLVSVYINDKLYLSSRMIDLLVQNKYGDSKKLYEICINRANYAKKENDFIRVRVYLELATKKFINNKVEVKRDIREKIAKTYEDKSIYELEKNDINYMVAANCLQLSIEEYRKVGGKKDKVDDLHKKMMEYQEKSIGYMKETSFKVELPKEISDEMNNKINIFKGKDKRYVLQGLAFMEDFIEKEIVRNQVGEDIKNNVFSNLFASVLVNEKVKNIAKQDGINSNKDNTDTDNKMYENSKLYFDIQATMLIEPVRKVILEEHNISERDLLDILNNNFLIPKDRVKFYSKGFIARFNGDFIVSTHLLIPQIENSIRCILEKMM